MTPDKDVKNSKKKMRVLVLSEGKPGHFNQSKGVVTSLSRYYSVDLDWQDVKTPNFAMATLSRFRRFLSYTIKPKAGLIKLIAGAEIPEEAPDLIISAGGATLPANVLLANYFNKPNIFCGTLRNVPDNAFSGVLVPYKEYENKHPYIVALKPCNIDPEKAITPRLKPTILFLLGGGSKTHRYTNEEWGELLYLIEEEHQKPSKQRHEIVVCTSRRTPDYVSNALAALSKRLPAMVYKDYRTTGAFNLQEALLQASFVVVTEDSNSMITEAVCAQKPLCILQPKHRQLSKLEESYIENLERDGRLVRIAFGQETTVSNLEEHAQKLQVMSENHLDILATKIISQIDL